MKHFEDLWEETEQISSKINILNPREQLHNEVDKLFSENSEDIGKAFGKVLYLLCYLSFKYNINTFAALLAEIQDHKIDLMEMHNS